MDKNKTEELVSSSVNKTRWGDVIRLDVNNLGASALPEDGDQEEWGKLINKEICLSLDKAAQEEGGDFSSFAEWTVTNGSGYDGNDMRTVRKEMFKDGYRAAISTLPLLADDANLVTWIQSVAYIPQPECPGFEQYLWKPDCHYDCEFMGLAPAVVCRFGGMRQIFLSGVVAWDKKDVSPQCTDDPQAQIRYVLQRIRDIFEEAGGSLSSVTRLRPFVHSKEFTSMLRDEVDSFFAGHAKPVIMAADGIDFGNPPQLFAEIQVAGIIVDDEDATAHANIELPGSLGKPPVTRVHSVECGDLHVVEVGEIRAPEGASNEVEELIKSFESMLDALALVPNNLCLVNVYVGDSNLIPDFMKEIGKVVPVEKLHVVPCKEMEGKELGFKVEVTAVKCSA